MIKLTLVAASLLLATSNVNALEFNVDAGTNNTVQVLSGLAGACPGIPGGIVMGADCHIPGSQSQSGTDIANFGFQIDGATSNYYDVDGSSGLGGSVSVDDVFTDNGTGEVFTLEGINSADVNYGNTWALSFDYTLYGAVVDTGGGVLAGGIAGGFVNLYYNDLTDALGIEEGDSGFDSGTTDDPTKVLSVAITGSSGPLSTSLGLNLFGNIDYSDSVNNDIDTSASFVTDFFNFVDPITVAGTTSTNFYDLWVAGDAAAPKQLLEALVVTTLNGLGGQGLTEVQDLVYGPDDSIGIDRDDLSVVQNDIINDVFGGAPIVDGLLAGTFATASRTGETLSGNLSLTNVPEPTSLAILGLGLLGFAGASRRKV